MKIKAMMLFSYRPNSRNCCHGNKPLEAVGTAR